MVNKAPKPQKAPKGPKQRRGPGSSFLNSEAFQKSEQLLKENQDAKPFEDMFYVLLVLLAVFLWRLFVAKTSVPQGAVGFWSVIIFASIAFINFFASFLVMVRARRQGSVAFLRITDSDVLRFTILSGVFGAWFAIFWYGFGGSEPKFFRNLVAASFFNVFWVAVIIQFYL
ncbi:hypothetical protein BGX29_011492 [Mortierella sp. GBA35]|nr:hypothetical protein BGX23_006695 [Mortierella sp. AD031]KAF9090409.1 hypothetical protein BGX29_011492 [Mortierella sp. GBA35]KAG0207483.1 hypothetical protein BGX33_006813 [Mortierella sp. NVP41]